MAFGIVRGWRFLAKSPEDRLGLARTDAEVARERSNEAEAYRDRARYQLERAEIDRQRHAVNKTKKQAVGVEKARLGFDKARWEKAAQIVRALEPPSRGDAPDFSMRQLRLAKELLAGIPFSTQQEAQMALVALARNPEALKNPDHPVRQQLLLTKQEYSRD